MGRCAHIREVQTRRYRGSEERSGAMSSTVKHVEGVLAERIEKDIIEPMADF